MNANNAEINADNAEQQQNAEGTPLEALNGLIFNMYLDNQQFKEGDYLKLMDYTKKIYDELKKKEKNISLNIGVSIPERVRMIRNKEDKLYILRRIRSRELEDSNISLSFYEKDDLLLPIRTGFRGVSIRLFSAGNTYKFMCVSKINIKSIKYDILYITEGRQTRIKKNNTLKFKDGDYYEDLSSYKTKQILIYNTSGVVCYALINEENLNWIDAETDNTLTIWN